MENLTPEKVISDLLKIANTFGYPQQKEKLFEEIFEVLDYRDEENLQEEIADCWIVISQLALLNPKIREFIKEKIKRTLERIESGYYYENKK